MHFSFPVALFYLATGAYSYVAFPPPTAVERSPPTIAERDLATATSVLADVRNGFDALSKAADEFNGDPAPLTAAASKLLEDVESGTTAINNMTPLSFFECLSLIDPAKKVGVQGQALADKLKSRKADVAKAKQCTVVHGFLDRGVSDSTALIAAIVKKVPSSLRGTVQDEGDKIVQTLKDAREEFAPGNCVDAV
ncbi:hypothetical protein K4F52_000851 [Lecanicillium sp. MT-2017a]|nr:hypothetical protein K4F52_000851 [Lecanicillium sp. MT-2017a]